MDVNLPRTDSSFAGQGLGQAANTSGPGSDQGLPRYMLIGITLIAIFGFLMAGLLRMAMGMPPDVPLVTAAMALPPLLISWVWHLRRWPGAQWIDASVYVTVVAMAQRNMEVNITAAFYVVPVVGVLYRDWRPVVYSTALSCAAMVLLQYPVAAGIPTLQLWADELLLIGLGFMYVALALLGRRADASLARARMTEQVARQWALSIEARDPYTGGHVERVTEYALALAAHVPNLEMDRQTFHLACILHDIGKIAVPDQILGKNGRLTAEEYAIMQTHSAKGGELLLKTGAPLEAVRVVRHHHERWDGRGYPDGFAGEAIPRAARLLAIADSFDAMTSDRPYRKALTPEAAREEIRRGAGSQYDPEMVSAFEQVYPQWVKMLAN